MFTLIFFPRFRVLVLHLKRYQQEEDGRFRKVDRNIEMPRFLTLNEHPNEHTSPPYTLDIVPTNE